MKKSIKINLGGLVLHVDDDAYDLLRNYLDQLQMRFTQVPGESEILNDIETRMAELFQEKLVPGKEVINLSDVREVIAVMGRFCGALPLFRRVNVIATSTGIPARFK